MPPQSDLLDIRFVRAMAEGNSVDFLSTRPGGGYRRGTSSLDPRSCEGAERERAKHFRGFESTTGAAGPKRPLEVALLLAPSGHPTGSGTGDAFGPPKYHQLVLPPMVEAECVLAGFQ